MTQNNCCHAMLAGTKQRRRDNRVPTLFTLRPSRRPFPPPYAHALPRHTHPTFQHNPFVDVQSLICPLSFILYSMGYSIDDISSTWPEALRILICYLCPRPLIVLESTLGALEGAGSLHVLPSHPSLVGLN